MKGPLCLVTGATGAVGPRVVEALDEAGYSVRILSRRRVATGLLPDEVEVCPGDVTDSSAVRSAMEGVEAVLHLAGLLHVVNAPASLRGEYERINVGGTAIMVEAAARAGVKRFVFFSTIAVYGRTSARILAESASPRPDNDYARTKLAAEQVVLAARGADDRPIGTVLRFGAVYGSRIKGNYERLVRSLACGRFIPIGDGGNRRTLIYDRDAAGAAVTAVHHPVAAGRVYNVSDGRYHALSDIIGAICAALGRKPPRVSLPVGMVRFAAGILEDAGRLVHIESPVTRSTIDKYTEDVAIDCRLIERELGFIPQFDLATGWRETVREMRLSGDL